VTALRRVVFSLALAALCAPTVVRGGSYNHTVACSDTTCTGGNGVDGHPINPLAIVHPLGFPQSGGVPTLHVCTSEPTGTGIPAAVDWAVKVWNELIPLEQNCIHCATEEDPDNDGTTFSLSSAILHEMGHCALGLGLINRDWDTNGDRRLNPASLTSS